MQDRSAETFSRDGIVVLDLCNVSYMDTLHANGRENLFWSQVRNWKPPLTSMGGQMTFDVANRRVAFSPLNTAMVGNAIDPDRSSERKMAWFHAKTWKPMGLMRNEEEIITRAAANRNDKKISDLCVDAILALLTTHKISKAESLAVLDRLAPLSEGDDRGKTKLE